MLNKQYFLLKSFLFIFKSEKEAFKILQLYTYLWERNLGTSLKGFDT